MAFINPGTRPPTEYLFVDGGALQSSAKDFVETFWPGHTPDIDWNSVKGGASKAFNYDAYPVRREDETEDLFHAACDTHDDLMDRISSHAGWHAYAGEARHRRKRGLEQKMVDVMIAVDMLRHTFNGNMEQCTLLTSDLDFKPLLDALIQEGMTTTLWHDPRKSIRDRRRSADYLRELNFVGLNAVMTTTWRNAHAFPTLSSGPLDTRQWNDDRTGIFANTSIPFRSQWRSDGMFQLIWPNADTVDQHFQIVGRDRDHLAKLALNHFGLAVPE